MVTKMIKGHCPNCGSNRNAEIVASHESASSDDEDGIRYWAKDQILQCGGCDEIYYRKEVVSTEDHPESGPAITYWPAPSKRKRPSWTNELMEDWDLYKLVLETYTALDNDAPVLAAIGLRTVFDRVSEKLRVEPALGFGEKLDALLKSGKIGQSERDTLEVLTDAGGAAAHRGWKPTIKQLDTLITIGEQFLYRTIILEDKAKAIRPKIPPRQKRKR
jgi:Domain of unknown function (DUF4145)